MPYVQLSHTDVAAACAAAPALARAIARALELEPADVLVGVTAQAGIYDGGGRIAPWPAVILHGRTREPGAMARAGQDAAALLARELNLATDRVFVQWSVPPPV